MSNLIDLYPHTNNKMYRFEVVASSHGDILVAIYKWSRMNEDYKFDCHLSPKAYTEMINEPDVLFDSIFEDILENDERSTKKGLIDELRDRNVTVNYAGYDTSRPVGFLNEEGAKAGVNLLLNKFGKIKR